MPTLPSAIEQLVSECSLLKHPFYLAWSAGKLSKEQLAGYAKEYYYVVRKVPEVVEVIEGNIPTNASQITRETFAKHVSEEREHIELWERFASALGVTEKELEKYEPTETVEEAVASIVEAASEGFPEGIAAMYAFECDLPAISKSKIEGLVKFYGMNSSDAHAYFEEHLAEEKHLCFWRELLRKVAPNKIEAALGAAKTTVAAQNRMLDGVVERYCPELACGCTEV